MTSRLERSPERGADVPVIRTLSCIHCAFFLLREERDAEAFLGREAAVAAWIAARTERSDTAPLFRDSALGQRLAPETHEEWRIVLCHEPLSPPEGQPVPPGYLDVLIYRHHDIATVLLEVSYPWHGDEPLRTTLERLHALAEGPVFEHDELLLGETSFPRLTIAQPCGRGQRRGLADAWRAPARRGDAPPLLHTPVLQGRADLYAVPPADSRGAWAILQIVDLASAGDLDGLTGNELRQIESYAHKVQRETDEYRRSRADFHRERRVLQESVRRWSVGEEVAVRPEALERLKRELNETAAVYLGLSRLAPFLQDVRTTVALNLDNLDRRRRDLGVPSGDDDGIYGTRSVRGHRIAQQIDGDLRYADGMLRQARTVLDTIGGHLEIRRQELAHEAAQREEVAQSRLLQTQTVLTAHLKRESVMMRWLTVALLLLTVVLAVDAVHKWEGWPHVRAALHHALEWTRGLNWSR